MQCTCSHHARRTLREHAAPINKRSMCRYEDKGLVGFHVGLETSCSKDGSEPIGWQSSEYPVHYPQILAAVLIKQVCSGWSKNVVVYIFVKVKRRLQEVILGRKRKEAAASMGNLKLGGSPSLNGCLSIVQNGQSCCLSREQILEHITCVSKKNFCNESLQSNLKTEIMSPNLIFALVKGTVTVVWVWP